MPFPNKKAGPGRPQGSRDFRPTVHKMLNEFVRVVDVVKALQAAYTDMTPKDRAWMIIELNKLGIQASPKDINQSNHMVVTLMIDGLKPKEIPIQVDSVRAITEGEDEESPE